MSEMISLELNDEQIARLDRAAQKAHKTRAEMARIFLKEALRLAEFPLIEFKDTAAGRVAFVAGTRVQIWWLVRLVREVGGDIAYVAENWGLRKTEVKAALDYATAFPDEIEAVTRANDVSTEELKRKLPTLEVCAVDLTGAEAPAS